MPDTPIDLSEGIQSVRLKVPTAEVPIPPEGFAQLHSPAPGELALRLPDGSVVPVGGGGGGGGDTISGDGGAVSTDATPGHDPGVVLSPNLGKTIWLNGPVVGPGENDPQAPAAVTLGQQSSLPATPTAGHVVFFATTNAELSAVRPDGSQVFRVAGSGGAVGNVGSGIVQFLSGGGALLQIAGQGFTVNNDVTQIRANDTVLELDCGGVPLTMPNLPTADPHVNNALWIAPITRQLMVSAG